MIEAIENYWSVVTTDRRGTNPTETAEIDIMLESLVAVLAGAGVKADSLDLDKVRSNYDRVKHEIVRVAGEEGIQKHFFLAVAWHESRFNSDARNPTSGAAGLFQLMPFHWESPNGFLYGKWSVNTWRDPRANAQAGAADLKAKGYGKLPIREVLRRYGGFVTKDPTYYVRDILARATVLMLRGE